ncbi:MAG TPA: PEP/pyruvate-binding domain-containing protein, partial [Jiangellales bacterium]|nr:PEP/pyruvate-binding domain-containing protein [Jiangellales bacterium]
MAERNVVEWLEDLSKDDIPLVGGKNAALGEMIRNLAGKGVRVPGGFATTAQAYWQFLDANDMRTRIADQIDALHHGTALAAVGEAIRHMFIDADFPPHIADAVTGAYRTLAGRLEREDPDVAVRSSGTAEDLPEASFAGQQETFLNITGEQA